MSNCILAYSEKHDFKKSLMKVRIYNDTEFTLEGDFILHNIQYIQYIIYSFFIMAKYSCLSSPLIVAA